MPLRRPVPEAGLVLVLLLAGCPPTTDQDEWITPPPEPPPVDASETEPNDEVPNDLGVVPLPWTIGGTSGGCGSDGSWDGADTDLLAFAVAEATLLPIELQATAADLDLAVYDPDGDLLAHLESADAFGESLTISIGPDATYTVEIRCWIGDADASWRLVLGELS